MTFTAFLLIGISVFMHVAWNLLSKAVRPSTAFYILMNGLGGLVWLPFFLMSWRTFTGLPFCFYLFLLCSLFFDVLYLYGLAHGYKRGDISLVYPLVRSLPVVMLALVTMLFSIGKPLSSAALAGMVLITLGCLIMPLESPAKISFRKLNAPVLLFVFMSAAGTVGYTLFDSQALKQIPNKTISVTLGYLFLIQAGQVIGQIPLIVCNPAERKALKALWGKAMVYPFFAGLSATGAYGLILFAMQFVSNVSYVQAFRQLSLPLGFLAGTIFLHEKNTPAKTAGIILIFSGLITVSVF